jgi:acetolactate synthase I/II/III large subunit
MFSTMTAGDAIVSALEANGVQTVFGLPGVQMYPLFDALYRRKKFIRTIPARHEQGCAYMAYGYAQSTGRPGVFSVVPGPGILNAGAGLNTAWSANAPVLCITGEVPTPFIGKRRGHLHEMPDQLATLRSFVKWAEKIERPADAPAVINEAFRQMLSGRRGPVAVQIAWDVLAKSEAVPKATAAQIDPALTPTPGAIEQAAQLLLTAKRPLIMAGSGAQHAAAEVLALAEALDAPVTSFRGGRGIVAEDHELGLSNYAASRLWPQVDVLLGIGSRLELPYLRWTNNYLQYRDVADAPPQLIRIDIDPDEMQRLRPHVPVVADSKLAAKDLLEALIRVGKKPTGERAYIAAAKKLAATAIQKIQPMVSYLEVIREVLPRDGFFVREVNQIGFASWYAFPVYQPRTYVSEAFSGTLGYGFPTALGVKVANPDKAVVCASSDGGFLFALQELASAAQEDINLVTLVFNNNAFGNVLRDQQLGFENRIMCAELQNPDFVKLAESFGVEAHRVDTPAALKPVLARALTANRPVLIEVPIPRGSEVSPWEFVNFKE